MTTTQSTMTLLPPTPGTCPVCATKHDPAHPHNAQSLYYQMRFYGLHGRWPTWADALAHVTSAKLHEHWETKLKELGHWSEPAAGVDVIAEPVAESIAQAIDIPVETIVVPLGMEVPHESQ